MVPPGFSLPVYTLDYVCYFIRVTTDRWGGKGKLGDVKEKPKYN